MPKRIKNNPDGPARILQFSHRNIYEPEVWRCSFFELENLLQEIDSVEMLAPGPKKWFYFRRSNAMRVGKYSKIRLNPGMPKMKLDKYYDLFFAVVEKPSELLNINMVEGVKDYCNTSICFLVEFWIKDMPFYKSALEVLSKFDHVICMFDKREPFNKVFGGECEYLPSGIDSLFFCPYPDPPERTIDVYSIGRRSAATHKALLDLVKQKKIFYVYDTINDLHAYDLEQHRLLFANIAKRSRYFIANPGKIDSPEDTGGQSEFGYRYFEGAAPGTIMIGEYPQNEQFAKAFNWPDALIHLPFDSPNIADVMKELDKDPERQDRIRKVNVTQTLLQHDWAYRWESILKIAGLKPSSELLERKKTLKNMAKMIEDEY